MKDGRTKRIKRDETMLDDPFLSINRASLIVEKGPSAGEEFLLAQKSVVLGRGPCVDVPLADTAMSREHVAFELQADGFRARDLASTNGMRINGGDTLIADLKHGDSIEVGTATLRYLVEPMPKPIKTHVIGD